MANRDRLVFISQTSSTLPAGDVADHRQRLAVGTEAQPDLNPCSSEEAVGNEATTRPLSSSQTLTSLRATGSPPPATRPRPGCRRG